ncbi:MAG: hypothetical protein NC548_56795 [Lachnospiraceae bacterium]|nr:hypothetical protein [Lachnospiraceae bacterium]
MYTIKDFKVGDSVYVEMTGNVTRGLPDDVESHIKSATIIKVGKKYVSAKIGEYMTVQFEETESNYGGGLKQHTNWCVDYILFKNKQDIYDKYEKESILRKLRNVFVSFSDYRIPLDKLREIYAIVKQYENK